MIPIFDMKKCTDCQLCVKECISRSIDKDTKDIIARRCILCGHCAAICPVEAVSINGKSGENLETLSPSFPEEFETLIKRRRSIRNYREMDIPRPLINRILKTVNNSPTGTNSRKVAITVIDSKEKIDHLTDIIMNHFNKIAKLLINPITHTFLLIFLGRKKTKKLYAYKRLISSYGRGKNILSHDAPLLMIFHTDKNSSTPHQDGLIWATTAMYVAESLGIGTCFNGFLVIGINTCSKARKYLGIPKGNKISETFTAGYPENIYNRSFIKDDLNVVFI